MAGGPAFLLPLRIPSKTGLAAQMVGRNDSTKPPCLWVTKTVFTRVPDLKGDGWQNTLSEGGAQDTPGPE